MANNNLKVGSTVNFKFQGRWDAIGGGRVSANYGTILSIRGEGEAQRLRVRAGGGAVYHLGPEDVRGEKEYGQDG